MFGKKELNWLNMIFGFNSVRAVGNIWMKGNRLRCYFYEYQTDELLFELATINGSNLMSYSPVKPKLIKKSEFLMRDSN